MGDNFQYVDIILFAMIAAFLVLRLRSVLGRHKDDGRPEDRPQDRIANDPLSPQPAPSGDDGVIQLPRRPRLDDRLGEAAGTAPRTPVDSGVADIRRLDPQFNLAEFLNGARTAFEMIVEAFAHGDRKTLKQLLNNDVFENFDGAVREREQRNETLENTLIRIVSTEASEVEVEHDIASVTVKIVSEQVNVTKNAAGEVVGGNPNHIAEVVDIWTFSRDLRSRDPNWKLVATHSE